MKKILLVSVLMACLMSLSAQAGEMVYWSEILGNASDSAALSGYARGPSSATTNQLPKFSTSGGKALTYSTVVEDGTDVNIQALNLVTTGYRTGKIKVITTSTGFQINSAPLTAVTDRLMYGGVIEASTQSTFVLAAKVTGMAICLYQVTAVTGGAVFKATGSDFFEDMATVGAGGGTITLSGNRNARVCVIGGSQVNKWLVISKDSNGVTVN